MLIGSGLLIFVGCTLVGYGAVQEEARRGLILPRRLPILPAAKGYLPLVAGAGLLLAGIVALFIRHHFLGFAGIAVSYAGCNLLTYVWGELIAHRGPRPRRSGRTRRSSLERIPGGPSPGAAAPDAPGTATSDPDLPPPQDEDA